MNRLGWVLGQVGWVIVVLCAWAGCSSKSDAGDDSAQTGGANAASAGQTAAAGSASGMTDDSAGASASAGGQSGGGAGGGGADSGGTSAEAGSGGAAGAGDTAGAAGGSNDGSSGPSQGCGVDANITPDEPTLQTITVDGVDAMYQNREYYIRLPPNYDVTRAYPLILLGHGCGGNGLSVIPINQQAGEDAIVVGLSSVGDCFATSGGMASPELPFFDAVLHELESNYCIERGKVFVAGFSSGAWLSNLIGCLRGDVVRGIGTMAGGLSDSIQGQCVGHIAAMMMGDTTDTANPIVNPDAVTGIDEGSGAAHALTAERNGCSSDTEAWDPEFPDCVENTGCDANYPVVWCVTTGKGHSDQVPMSTVGLWRFWSSLP